MDNWRIHQGSFFICLILTISYFLYKKFGSLITILFLFCSISSLVYFQTNIPFYDPDTFLMFRINVTASETFGKIMIMALLALFWDKWRPYSFRIIELLTLGNALLVAIKGWGIFNASSLDAAMLACAMPMIIFRDDPYKYENRIYGLLTRFLPLIAIYRTGHSATAYFVMIGCVLAFVLKTKYWEAVVLGALVFFIGLWVNGLEFFSSSLRVQYWTEVFNWWWPNMNHWIGTGLGTFEILGPISQMSSTGRNDGLLLWMHNDYLQMLYEGGYLGLFIGLITWAWIGFKSFKNLWTFMTFAGFSVCMLTYYPLHFAWSEFFMLIFTCEVLWKENESQTLMS